jgi:hypothetical protein
MISLRSLNRRYPSSRIQTGPSARCRLPASFSTLEPEGANWSNAWSSRRTLPLCCGVSPSAASGAEASFLSGIGQSFQQQSAAGYKTEIAPSQTVTPYA